MKIAFVSNTAFSMWNFRRHIIRALLEDGHQIVCFVTEDHTCEHLRDMGVEVVTLPLSRSGMNPLVEIRLITVLFKLLKKHKPDVVISYTIKPNSYVPLIARLLGIKSLAVVTGLGYAFLQNSMKAFFGRFLLRSGLGVANHIWFLNDEDADMFVKRQSSIENKISIIPGEGIDTDFFDDKNFGEQKNENFIFLMISRLLKDKGVREYVEAAKLVRLKYPNTEFRIIGSLDHNNPSAISEEDIKTWQMEGNIVYLGQKNDVRPEIIKADICVLPSYREGIPFSLIEAASMRRPLIATNVAGCRDVVIHQKTGYLATAKSAESLAQAMISMINLPQDQFYDMKEAAREDMIRRFSKEIVIECYRSFLKRI